jgi:hypothetical protein
MRVEALRFHDDAASEAPAELCDFVRHGCRCPAPACGKGLKLFGPIEVPRFAVSRSRSTGLSRLSRSRSIIRRRHSETLRGISGDQQVNCAFRRCLIRQSIRCCAEAIASSRDPLNCKTEGPFALSGVDPSRTPAIAARPARMTNSISLYVMLQLG